MSTPRSWRGWDCEGGRLLDIDVVDHLIVTPEGFCSFAQRGLMP